MNNESTAKTRLRIGSIILILGFLSPAFIPLVAMTNLSVGLKSTISGLLVLGIPELAIILAIGVMGKDGFIYFKQKLARVWSRIGPPEKATLVQHRIGVVLFLTPLVVGFLQPYQALFIDFLAEPSIYFYIIMDFIFLSSLWFLGSGFWDKLHRLFLFNSENQTSNKSSN